MKSTCKPNLFIVGAAKSGTSSLADYLGQHPEVCICPIKEPFFFIEGIGVSDEEEYLKLFEYCNGERIIGEASTGYLFDECAVNRIKDFQPEAKIIIMLRNPPDMAYSYWKYMQLGGNENLSFENAISLDVRNYRKTKEFEKKCINWSRSYLYVERAKYAEQVKRYIKIFGRDNVKIIIFERFVRNIEAVVNEVFEFVGVDNKFTPNIRVINKGGALRSLWIRDNVYHRQYPLLKKILPAKWREKIRFAIRDLNRKQSIDIVDAGARKLLIKEFAPDIEALEHLLGMKITEWQ